MQTHLLHVATAQACLFWLVFEGVPSHGSGHLGTGFVYYIRRAYFVSRTLHWIQFEPVSRWNLNFRTAGIYIARERQVDLAESAKSNLAEPHRFRSRHTDILRQLPHKVIALHRFEVGARHKRGLVRRFF